MIYEFRRAFAVGGKLGVYKALIADAGLKAFAKHEIEPVGFFDVVIGPGSADEFPYLLRWKSFDERVQKLAALEQDPEWRAAVEAAEADGPLLVNTHSELWEPTYYRPEILPQKNKLYEYRTSRPIPGKKDVVHWRNAEYNVRLYAENGINYVAAFDAIVGNSAHVHYFMGWDSLEERAEKWTAYMTSPGFQEIAGKTGPLTRHVPNEIWSPTAFSPIMG